MKRKKKRTVKKTKKQNKKGLTVAFKWLIVLGLWGLIILGLTITWYARELPDITKAMVFERRPTIIVKSSEGKILDRYGDIKGKNIAIEDIPTHVIYAFLAIEDRRFYQHFGLDLIGVSRAMVVNVKNMGFVQGGSTITQQLAKNLFLSRERTLKRKIQEAMLALWLEQNLTKDEILSAYLNRVYMGSGAYGIDAAARVYFNKSVQELSIREGATIAGLLKAPSRYSPHSNPTLAAKRTQTVLNAMANAGFVSQEDIKKYHNLPPSPRRKPSSGETVRYFTDFIVSQIDDLIGPSEEDLIIETTLNSNIQEIAETTITKAILSYGNERSITQGATVLIRMDGAIIAMVGGRDYGVSQFNRASNSFRPPGSSFKPIVYLAALENGWQLDDMIVDEPITEGSYQPKNYGDEYFGEVTLIEALTRSLNTVSVNLMREIKPEKVIHLARRLGITADLEPDLSLALGSSGIPVIEMATAYAAIGRGGISIEPFAIRRITNKNGDIYYERPEKSPAQPVVAAKHIYDLTQMMQSVIQNGTGTAAQLPYPAAGKTGTSQEFRDAWFNGFTNRYAAAVWFGNDDNTPMKRVTGGSIPALVWRDIMLAAHNQKSRNIQPYHINVSSDLGFQDLINRILSGNQTSLDRRHRRLEKEDYTPLGRHQWDLNE